LRHLPLHPVQLYEGSNAGVAGTCGGNYGGIRVHGGAEMPPKAGGCR